MSTYPGERCKCIKTNGTQCGSPAIRDTKFCYFRTWCRPTQIDVSTFAAEPPAPFLLPALKDAASIQLAITQVCEHLLHRRLDSKKAATLLYAMQVASSNLSRLTQEKTQENTHESPADAPESSDPDRLPPGTSKHASSEADPWFESRVAGCRPSRAGFGRHG